MAHGREMMSDTDRDLTEREWLQLKRLRYGPIPAYGAFPVPNDVSAKLISIGYAEPHREEVTSAIATISRRVVRITKEGQARLLVGA